MDRWLDGVNEWVHEHRDFDSYRRLMKTRADNFLHLIPRGE
jgi:hypothetical protein